MHVLVLSPCRGGSSCAQVKQVLGDRPIYSLRKDGCKDRLGWGRQRVKIAG